MVTAYNIYDVSTFFQSVALARALAANTTTKFEPQMDNTVVNLMYNIMPWKERFGTMQLQQPPQRALKKATSENFVRFMDGWVKAVGQGAGPVTTYMEKMQKIRDTDRDNLAGMIEDNAKINEQVFAMMKDHIIAMSAVKCTATIISAGLGAAVAITVGGGAALIACGVSMTRGVITEIANTWDNSATAKVVGVGFKGFGPTIGEKVGDYYKVEKAFEKATEQKDLAQEAILSAQKTIDQYSRLIAMGVKKSVRGQYEKTIMDARRAEIIAQDTIKATQQTAQAARLSSKTIPIASAVLDSGFALWDFHEELEAVDN